jgi:hypothetical protein
MEGVYPDWIKNAATGSRSGAASPRPKAPDSPYSGLAQEAWPDRTRQLLLEQPLHGPELVDAVLRSWDAIFESRLGRGFHIGREIKPGPQIMGFFLHALIPLELASTQPNWRAEITAADKDLVYVPNERFSIEVKTSSHPSQIFGNRSYGIENPGRGKKAKSGYYLTVNFEKWQSNKRPQILLIRYGWLDSSDWIAQRAETGQQSSLPPPVDNYQLLRLYSA